MPGPGSPVTVVNSGGTPVTLYDVNGNAISLPGGFIPNVATAGLLVFSDAASEIVPGATSFAISNSADTLDNLIITDAGALTVTGQAGASSGVQGAGHVITTGAGGGGNANGGDVTVTMGAGTGTGRWGQFSVLSTVAGAESALTSTHNALLSSQLTLSGLTTDFNPSSFDTYVTESVLTTDTSAYNMHGKFRAFYPHTDIRTTSTATIDRAENLVGIVNVTAGAAGTLSYGYGVSGELLHFSPTYTVTSFDASYGLVALLDNGTVGTGHGGNFSCSDTAGKTGTFTTIAIGVNGFADHLNAQTSPLHIGIRGYASNGPGTLIRGTGIQAYLAQTTTGTMTVGYGMGVTSPTISGTGVISTIEGSRIDAQYNTASGTSTTGGYFAYGEHVYMPTQGGNTSGIDLNVGIQVDTGGGASGVGGTGWNRGVVVYVPNPTSAGTAVNTALYLTGNGGTGGTTTNYALYSGSTAASVMLGSLAIGSTTTAVGTGALAVEGKVSRYNAIATTGLGVPAIYSSLTTGTITNATTTIVNAFAVPVADSLYEIAVSVNVTASVTAAMTVTVSYTDVANVARVETLAFNLLTGLYVQSITTAQGNIDYTGDTTLFRCKASTTITIATAGTVTGITYTAAAIIKQIA